MKTKLLLLGILFLLLPLGGAVSAQDGDHEHSVSNHCDNPTRQLNITAGAGGTLTYDKTEYEVPKATCIMLTLINAAVDTDHDLEIHEVTGDDGIEQVHLHAMAGMRSSMHILTPDADTDFEIYCTIEGHRDQGMEAVLIVGDGSSALPINFGMLFFGFLAAIPILRRRN